MSSIFEDRRITSPLTGESDETDFTVDNIGDVITVETDFRMETYMIPDSIDENGTGFFIFVDPRPAQTGKVRDDRAIYANNVLAFNDNDWHVGDTWELTGMTIPANNTTGTIIEISEDRKTIITDYNFTVPEVLPLDAYLVNTTTITAVTYKHGLIGNDEFVNYISKVDSSEQIAQLGGLSNNNLSYQTATLLGNKSWQSGSVQIKGNEIGQGNPALISGAVQAFTIKHELIISPLMLADEWQDILNGLKPDILRNEASLRYVFSIDAAPVLKNPNNTTSVLVDEFTGNIGAKDENFNGVPTNYIVSDVVYSIVSSGDITDSLNLTTDETKITFTVTSSDTVTPPFLDGNGNNKAIFKFNYAPANESEYRDSPEAIAETMEHNFMFDDVLSTLGSSSGTPRRFGTSDQVIKEMTTTYVSDSVITVDVRIQLSSEIASRLANKVDRRYMLYFSVANHTLSRKDSDKASITVDNNLFFNDVTDPTLLPMANSFMAHTGSVVGTDNVGSLSARVKDDVCCITNLAIDRNGRESDDITISGVTMQIIARKDANTFDVLDEYSTSLNLEIINDIPFVDLTIDRGFATPVDDLRKNIRFKRREDLDDAGFFAYELNFPIIMRWEYWEARDNANEDFFNTSEPNNGWNHDWAGIAATSGWDIYYKATVNVVKNGNPLTYTAESKIELEDYLEGTEWDTENIKTYIDSTNDPIFDSPNYGVSLAENTRVEADMTYLGAESYVPADLVSVLMINAKERGNFKELYTLSSLYPPHPNTKWLGISPSDMAVITNPSGDIFRTAGILDYTLLQGEDNWQGSQRIYNPPFDDVKEMEDGTTKNLEDDSTKTLE